MFSNYNLLSINWFKTSALEPCMINTLATFGSEDRDQLEIF